MSVKFNPKGPYHLYSGGDRREVYLQDGRFFNTKHELLPANLEWLDANGYAMNHELRNEVVRQQARLKHRKELEALKAKIAAEEARMLVEQEVELAKHHAEMTSYSAPPPAPSKRKHAPIQLTAVEKDLYGDTSHEAETQEEVHEPEEVDEDDDGDLFRAEDLNPFDDADDDEDVKAGGLTLSKDAPDPFENGGHQPADTRPKTAKVAIKRKAPAQPATKKAATKKGLKK